MSTEHNVADLINSYKTNVVFVNNGILFIYSPPQHFSIDVYTSAALGRVFTNCMALHCVEVGQPRLRGTHQYKLHPT